jgi:hypothetical protein
MITCRQRAFRGSAPLIVLSSFPRAMLIMAGTFGFWRAWLISNALVPGPAVCMTNICDLYFVLLCLSSFHPTGGVLGNNAGKNSRQATMLVPRID